MLDTVSLSEEELGLLFSPTSNGGGLVKPETRLAINARKASRMRVKSAGAMKTSTSAVKPARCGYRTGKCPNLQTIKRNGKLHKLCEFHRERANLNQKKLDRKKRLQRTKSTSSTASSSSESVASEDDTQSVVDSTDGSPRTVDAIEELSNAFPVTEHEDAFVPVLPTSLNEAPLALSCEELAIFCSLMAFDMTHRPSLATDSCSPHTPCPQHTSIV